MRKSLWVMLVLVLASFILSLFFYQQLPLQMASHWDVRGEVDGYMHKNTALFIVPTIMTVLAVAYFLIKPAKYFKDHVKKSSHYADQFLIVLLCFFLYSHLIIIVWNLGYRFNFIYAFLPVIGLLFIYLGFILPHLKRNYFIGIRTPWTLKDESVWEKTHMLGGQIFKVIGILMILSVFIPDYAFGVIISSVVFSVLYSFIYSYKEFKKLEIHKKKI